VLVCGGVGFCFVVGGGVGGLRGGGGGLTRVLLLIGSVLCEGPEADSWLRAVRLQLSFILFLFVWFLVFSV